MPNPEMVRIGGKKIPRHPANRMRRVVVVSNGSVGVIVVLKSASRSMVKGGYENLLLGRDTLPDELHVFVRDPIDRLKSAYQFFRKRPPIEYYDKDTLTWEEFIDFILEGAENPHWRPVADMLESVGRPVVVHLFENLNEEFPLGKLDRRNPSKKDKSIDLTYRQDELKALYADDYDLRHNV